MILLTSEFLIHIINYLSDLGVSDNNIKIVIALGGHRKSTKEEQIHIVGEEVYKRIKVYDHESEDK